MAAPTFARVRTADGAVVCERCEIPESSFGRMRGLLGRDGLEPGGRDAHRLGAGSVHMFFMRFPIDVVFLARDRTVVGVRHGSRRGVSPAHGAQLPRSSSRPEGLPKRASKRETRSFSRSSPTAKAAEERSISERHASGHGAVDYRCCDLASVQRV